MYFNCIPCKILYSARKNQEAYHETYKNHIIVDGAYLKKPFFSPQPMLSRAVKKLLVMGAYQAHQTGLHGNCCQRKTGDKENKRIGKTFFKESVRPGAKNGNRPLKRYSTGKWTKLLRRRSTSF